MLYEQIAKAKLSLLDIKRSPVKWLLPEYQELQRARGEYMAAKARLHEAEKRWNALGQV